MQFCKLEVFNFAYLYALHLSTKHYTREQNCLKMSKHKNNSIKITYKALKELNSQKGTKQLKMKKVAKK